MGTGIRNILALSVVVAIATSLVYVMPGTSTAEHASLSTPISPAVSAAAFTPRAVVTIMVGNSSNQVLFDYVDKMDLAGIHALAQAHQAELIPPAELLAKLPAPLAGWAWAMPGGQYSVINQTLAVALGLYLKGTIMSYTEMAQVGIHHQVGGWSTGEWDEEAGEPPEGVKWDAGYPKELTVQGYPAMETRSSGENLGGEFEEMNLDAVGMLWVGLGTEAPVPEISMVGTFAALLSVAAVAIIRHG